MEYLTPACAARCIIILKFFAIGYIFFTKLVSEISIFLNLKFFFLIEYLIYLFLISHHNNY